MSKNLLSDADDDDDIEVVDVINLEKRTCKLMWNKIESRGLRVHGQTSVVQGGEEFLSEHGKK